MSRDLAKALNDMFRKEAGYTSDALKPASTIEIETMTTGSLGLDRALGGGYVRGRSVELSGELSTLKTFFAQMAIAEAQAEGMSSYMFDPEGSFDPIRAEQLGVDTDRLEMIDRNLRGDQGLDVVDAVLRQGNAIVVVDSIASLAPKAEVERKIGEDTVARQAAMMSVAMRKLTQANRNGILIFINQLRESVGVMFGSPIRTPGGRAVPFYATHLVRFSRIETIKTESTYFDAKTHTFKKGERATAWLIQARVMKNKAGRPFQETVFRFDLEAGLVDEAFELLNLGLELGLVTKTDNKFRWADEDGVVIERTYATNAMKLLRERPETLRPRVVAELVAERARARSEGPRRVATGAPTPPPSTGSPDAVASPGVPAVTPRGRLKTGPAPLAEAAAAAQRALVGKPKK